MPTNKSATIPALSVVVPIFNEIDVIDRFNTELIKSVSKTTKNNYEVIYVSDGSTDKTVEKVTSMAKINPKIRLIALSRNFGKENSLTAGLANAKGRAVLMMDGDGQHPPSYIPKFYNAWINGAKVVVGVRLNSSETSFFKSKSSYLFHKLINMFTDKKLVYGSTDFRLIDSEIQKIILKMPETNRVMRAIIDWLGFEPVYIDFKASKRYKGSSSFSTGALLKLAIDSFASMTPRPLYFIGYLGLLITLISFVLGSTVFVEQLILNDPLSWEFTGTAMLAILIIFLVGLILTAQGILSLYISHMHNQTLKRPLYIIDFQKSVRIDSDNDK